LFVFVFSYFLCEPYGQIERLCQIVVLLQLLENDKKILKKNNSGVHWHVPSCICHF